MQIRELKERVCKKSPEDCGSYSGENGNNEVLRKLPTQWSNYFKKTAVKIIK
jgi:hypothetical protein